MRIQAGESFGGVDAMFHQGACSDTTQWDGRHVMARNFSYSKALHRYCTARGIAFIYASSASVYGSVPEFREERACENPLNMYGFSKFA